MSYYLLVRNSHSLTKEIHLANLVAAGENHWNITGICCHHHGLSLEHMRYVLLDHFLDCQMDNNRAIHLRHRFSGVDMKIAHYLPINYLVKDTTGVLNHVKIAFSKKEAVLVAALMAQSSQNICGSCVATLFKSIQPQQQMKQIP